MSKLFVSIMHLFFTTVMFLAFMLAGCGDNGDGGNPAGEGGGGGDPNITYGSFTDSRDGKSYKTVTIGGKIWMAENLNYQTDSSWCYANADSNCTKYGRLYTWSAALTACPSGWHLPADAEWTALTDAVGGSPIAGIKLKSVSGWRYYSGIISTDEYGFSALPGGYRFNGGDFFYIGRYGGWWTATVDDASYAYYRGVFYYFEGVGRNSYYRSGGFSARCLRD
ncbi:MAG: fibrobacter succinogenes major paralogous domain-containing protein [Chitinispirillales bacterium]|jgi:uncharacterized protein (TIGR02145 family)|nr:fibrobacter succinogenes major paralogous domain-containing protein [Chitinispirillales bacterium]